MLTWDLLVGIIALGLIALYWRTALIVKERAERAARTRCDHLQLQFLDESIALQSVWFQRNSEGRLRLRRTYHFEFTATGADRTIGRVKSLGKDIVAVEVGAHRIH